MSERDPDTSDVTYGLRSYQALKQALGDVVRATLARVAGPQMERVAGAREVEDALRELLGALAADRFNLVVVGQFKRGKSSLMNALIGRDLLPTGLLPLTSAITTLRYGSRERVTLQRTGWNIEQEIPLRELPGYVTEQGNPGNEKGLIEARVELPARFLRRGLFFVDTPGVGSASERAASVTYDFLPDAHAIIFVTSVEAPMSEVEMSLLSDIRLYVQQLFIAVNKVDTLSDEPEEARAAVLDYIQRQASQALDGAQVPLYPVSAREGLAAARSGDQAALAQSGIPALEHALADYLTREQGRAFLRAILAHLEGALTQLAHLPPQPDAPTDATDVANVAPLRERVAALRATLEAGDGMDDTMAERALELLPGGEAPTVGTVVETLSAASEHPTASASAASPRAGRCPICAALGDALFNLFARWQHTLASDVEARRAFAALGGFCHAHTWQFERIASPQGISEGFAPLIERMEGELRAALEHTDTGSLAPDRLAEQIAQLTPRMTACPACHALREERDSRIAGLIETLRVSQSASPADQSSVPVPLARLGLLCLPHLSDTLAATVPLVDGKRIAAILLRAQARGLGDLVDDLRNYTLKRAALRQSLLTGEESSAWRRALAALVGERDGALER